MVELKTAAESPAPRLKRGLGTFELAATGTGIILGAGIYVIIGRAAGLAGGAIWVPFLLGALAAAFTGLSYGELASMFPRAGAAFEYTRQAFGTRLAFTVGWLMLFSYMISAAAVALGFGGYLSQFMGLAIALAAVLLIGVACAVLLVGIKETVWVGVLFTAIEAVGLLVVVGVSLRFFGAISYLEMPQGVAGLFRATTLLFFAYLGFEQVANLGEEARDPGRAVPAAIVLSVLITTVLYMLVAFAAVSVLGWEALSQSDAPLADVVQVATGTRVSQAIATIALFATANTVLFLLLTSSRLMYGMASSGSLPRVLGTIHPRRYTPWVATLAASGIAAVFTLLGDIEVVAQTSNFAVLVAFAVVNFALIWLRLRRPDLERPFRVPLAIAGVPVTAVLGAGFSLFMMANVGLAALGYGALITLAGIAIAFFLPRHGRPGEGATSIQEMPRRQPMGPGRE